MKLSPEMEAKWVRSNIEEAVEEMASRNKTISPESVSRYFTKWSDGLELTVQEAKEYLESCDWYQREHALKKCLEAFMASSDFGEGCANATRKSWSGGGCSVELFQDGTWRVLFNEEIGNLYESPGEILGLPTLDDDDYQQCVVDGDMTDEDYFLSVYQNDEEELKQLLRDRLAGVA